LNLISYQGISGYSAIERWAWLNAVNLCLVYLEEFREGELPKGVKVLTHVFPRSQLLNIYNNFSVGAQD
jgi:hypothetical protein